MLPEDSSGGLSLRVNTRRETVETRVRSAFAVGVLLGAALLLLPSGAIAQSVNDSNISAKIESAKTAADHEAVAKYFDAQAAAEKERLELHKKMKADYQGLGKSGTTMAGHCDGIISRDQASVADYEALAKDHRDMAKEAK
jgi:hypothetical protein